MGEKSKGRGLEQVEKKNEENHGHVWGLGGIIIYF